MRAIVEQINALEPDIVLFAGDFVSDKAVATTSFGAEEALAPLADLTPPLGSVAVLGNHDYWRNDSAIAQALIGGGVNVLRNEALAVGPLAIGGVDDDVTGHADVSGTVEKLRQMPGLNIVLSHSPDIFPAVPSDISMVFAGHTHCGQIAPPLVGPIFTASKFGRRYACGIVRENGRTLIVGAGLGTSILPLRLGVPPDLWVIDLRPRSAPTGTDIRPAPKP